MVSIRVQKAKAVKKMTVMGFPKDKVQLVLNNLLRVYDNNWRLIEENNYDVLVNALLDADTVCAGDKAGPSDPPLSYRRKRSLLSRPSPAVKRASDVSPQPSRFSQKPGHIPPEGSPRMTRALARSVNESEVANAIATYQGQDKHSVDEGMEIIVCLDDTMDEEASSSNWTEHDENDYSAAQSRHLDEPNTDESPAFEVPPAVMGPLQPPSTPKDSKNKKEPVLNASSKQMTTSLEPASRNAEGPLLDSTDKNLQGKLCCDVKFNGSNDNGRQEKNFENSLNSHPETLARIPQPHLARCILKSDHDANDIAKGEERFRVSVADDIKYPLPSFNYIRQNVIHHNAFINLSVSGIGDDSCCPKCSEDCLTAPNPCPCAGKNGGQFAYTKDGLVKKDFLDSSIATKQNAKKHNLFYCKDCPLERCLNKVAPDPCKGHLQRKFIKECWIRCGCKKYCSNRVVQGGINCNLEVFITKRKGWGLRTQDELPRGSFVCEFVGEILTNLELHDQMVVNNTRNTHPILLDADWGSQVALKDGEALCLDATCYGNVARFINHRCSDANLIEIPVEVETRDHRYYHLAFFTTRDVQTFEELTWDYGIDFENHDSLVKAFQCDCGSKFCRDLKRRPRKKRN